jgi:hypothetical protein
MTQMNLFRTLLFTAVCSFVACSGQPPAGTGGGSASTGGGATTAGGTAQAGGSSAGGMVSGGGTSNSGGGDAGGTAVSGGGTSVAGGGTTVSGGGTATTGGGTATTGGGTANTGGGTATTGGGTATTGGGTATTGGGTATTGGGTATAGGGTATTGGGTATTGGGTATTGGGTMNCSDLCSDGTSICDGLGFRTCSLNPATGCRQFGAINACTNGLLCSAGTCSASCTDQCTMGAKQCSSSGSIVSCVRQPSNCTEWVVDRSCAMNEVCSGGQCVPQNSCTNQCTLNATRCTAGTQKQTCLQQPNGCTDWTLPQACMAGQSCVAPATACAPIATCTVGAKRCAAQTSNVETCDQNGNWIVAQNCPQACSQGACTASATCSAGAARCNGTNVELCNSTGTAWLYNQTCNTSCTNGVCADPCVGGAKRCNANVPEVCNAAGTAWTASQSCATSCYRGDCTQADLLVDGTTVTLEGDLKYQNSVIVRNGGSIKVGPSGILKIQANTINIDGASNINANDVGDETRCAGGPAIAGSYYCPYNGQTKGTTTNLPACYGAAVATGTCSFTSFCSSYICIGPSSPGVYDRSDDISISEGSAYGSVKGGGLISLRANSIQVAGQITANASASGPSGGGIFIAGDTLNLGGPVQTAGGGSGSIGRVKTLRGAMATITGTVVGTRSNSVMPPLELVSGSHPISSLWYNDGLGPLFLAWNKPFPSANGYYFVANTNPDTVPSPANGTFVSGESRIIPAATLVEGTNYFHIVSVDSAVNIGTVKNTFVTNVNTQPVTLLSASHPSSTSWSMNNSVFLNWTNPQADSNFTGYYYVFDKFADTIPNPTAATLTPNKQVLLANTADGIWYFHLVSKDTRNAVTKTAAHYQVRIGVAPVVSNLSGSVFNASAANAPLAGVSIKINRGVFTTTTTNAGTYTFSNTLYVGQWEVTASKPGFTSQTKMINLMPGMPLNENFSLTVAP